MCLYTPQTVVVLRGGASDPLPGLGLLSWRGEELIDKLRIYSQIKLCKTVIVMKKKRVVYHLYALYLFQLSLADTTHQLTNV